MIEIKDVLNLLGKELKDDTEQAKRFREFVGQEKWSTDQIRKWFNECIVNSVGAHDPYNRAFQDLVIFWERDLDLKSSTGDMLENQGKKITMGFGKEKMEIL